MLTKSGEDDALGSRLGGPSRFGVRAAVFRPRVCAWERDLLARDDMLLSADALDLAYDEHIYFSKEASSGGQGFAGGGCGCN